MSNEITHEEWLEELFEEAGRKMWDAKVARLLEEFKALGDARFAALKPQHDDDVGDM